MGKTLLQTTHEGQIKFYPEPTERFSNAYLHFVADDTRWVGGHGTIMACVASASTHVESPAVQRTEHFTVLQTAGAKRAAAMRASVVNAIELATQVPHRELPAADMHGAT